MTGGATDCGQQTLSARGTGRVKTRWQTNGADFGLARKVAVHPQVWIAAIIAALSLFGSGYYLGDKHATNACAAEKLIAGTPGMATSLLKL